MNKHEIVNLFIDKYNFKTLLEITTNSTGMDVHNIEIFKIKPDIIRYSIVNHVEKLKHKYDIIFIDSHHFLEISLEDILFALDNINSNGVIVIHDCLPHDINMTGIPNCKEWCGQTYEAFLKFHMTKDLHMYIIDTDFGVGVIDMNLPSNRIDYNACMFDYNEFYKNRCLLFTILIPDIYKMHMHAGLFLTFVKNSFPEYFQNKKVLDVGSGDINGNNRNLFTNCDYTGNDVAAGKNVTIVCKTSELPFEDETFDTIISSECFEHDPEWKESLLKITRLLKPGGLLLFTCASTDRPEHGTRRSLAYASLISDTNHEWQDYYMNLTADMILGNDNPINYHSYSTADSYYASDVKDLYVYAIKRGGRDFPLTKLYIRNNVIRVAAW